MATLVRTRTAPVRSPSSTATQFINPNQQSWDNLQRSVPTPFPTLAEREQEELLHELAQESLQLEQSTPARASTTAEDAHIAAGDAQATSSGTQEMTEMKSSSVLGPMCNAVPLSEDIIPSLIHVQNYCIMTINDLLCNTPQWRPIMPGRRHSMPSCAPGSTVLAAQPSSALHTLVLNLRVLDGESSDLSLESSSDAATLIRELDIRVNRLADSPTFPPQDAVLIRRLGSLIWHFHRLTSKQPCSASLTANRVASWGHGVQASPADPIAALGRELSDLRLARDATISGSRRLSVMTPVQQVEGALLWAQIDEELEEVLSLCRSRAHVPDAQPPDYEMAWYDVDVDAEGLPQYEAGSSTSRDDLLKGYASNVAETPSTASRGPAGSLSEKMRMDLEAVSLAIDRLYLVAPQLHDQRVELKKSKVEQMEKASRAGPSACKGKQRASDVDEVQELEKMVDLIGRASQRKIPDQAVVLEGGLKTRLEQAHKRDKEKRDAFVEQLLQHADAGRLHSQDAVLMSPGTVRIRSKDPEALLTLPEFIRETVPESRQLKIQMEDPKALLTLPEFVKEPVPKGMDPVAPKRKNSLIGKGMRSRSVSAPPLAWLLATSRSSSPNPGSTTEPKKSRSSKMRRVGSSIAALPAFQINLEVTYVAEYHESLQHVLVFLTVLGMMPGTNLEAEVVPASQVPGIASDGPEFLVLKCGLSTSPYLRLPARIAPGKKDVSVAGQHFQVKLSALTASVNDSGTSFANAVHGTLMDASCLSAMRPANYVCASCSLPLVHAFQLEDYRDLPSEHWAELVDAWMCHSDQKLHDHVTKHSTEGFWPTEGNALVGGSYILFEQSAMATYNLCTVNIPDEIKHEDGWERVRCLCGSLVGRRQEHRPVEGTPSLVYRLAKYAIRPQSTNLEPSRIPLSAFIVEDMNEFVHAHATYRFVIADEEEERPRILIWLFKPSMRISYTTPTEYVMPKNASIHAAKVLFKLLGPSSAYSDLQSVLHKYPGFPQAEHLYYPREICRRLAGFLKESNTAYPEGMRTMTGLDVGWLQRA